MHALKGIKYAFTGWWLRQAEGWWRGVDGWRQQQRGAASQSPPGHNVIYRTARLS